MPLGSQGYSMGVGRKNNKVNNSLPSYNIRHRDLGKIHKAASFGKEVKVQQILLLGEKRA